ncbi:RluA family pseudouridine synthase [Patescibacteria group bacterium]|nr:RluA family pseudouridine synthase [Patescibacteria group bacterium]
MNKKIKITAAQSNQRIDKFLAGFCAERSRARWQKMIKSGRVLVNSKEIKPDYVLKEGDEAEIIEITPKIPLTPFDKGGNACQLPPAHHCLRRGDDKTSPSPSLSGGEIKIIYEDDDVIVIDKPAGVLSQKAESSKAPAVSDFLVRHYPKIKNVGEDEMRFGVVHRLDKDTSGVIIVAKNNKSFEFLKDQFKNRKVQKTYTALVYGTVEPKEGIIDLKIGRSKTRPNMQTVIDTKKKADIKSREALSLYKTVKNYENYTLLEVQPKTGRMHQIRVHLKALGFPVVGDKKYFFKKYRNIEPKLERQFLHAGELKIKLPNGKISAFRLKLPKDLKSFLNEINKK